MNRTACPDPSPCQQVYWTEYTVNLERENQNKRDIKTKDCVYLPWEADLMRVKIPCLLDQQATDYAQVHVSQAKPMERVSIETTRLSPAGRHTSLIDR